MRPRWIGRRAARWCRHWRGLAAPFLQTRAMPWSDFGRRIRRSSYSTNRRRARAAARAELPIYLTFWRQVRAGARSSPATWRRRFAPMVTRPAVRPSSRSQRSDRDVARWSQSKQLVVPVSFESRRQRPLSIFIITHVTPHHVLKRAPALCSTVGHAPSHKHRSSSARVASVVFPPGNARVNNFAPQFTSCRRSRSTTERPRAIFASAHATPGASDVRKRSSTLTSRTQPPANRRGVPAHARQMRGGASSASASAWNHCRVSCGWTDVDDGLRAIASTLGADRSDRPSSAAIVVSAGSGVRDAYTTNLAARGAGTSSARPMGMRRPASRH